MKIKLIIDRLKATCPIFLGRVSGAAALAQAVELAADWTVPAAFVVPLSETADQNELLGDFSSQWVAIRFGVAILVSNTSDEPGFTAAEAVVDAFAQIRAALVGWQPSETFQAIDYVSGELGEFDRARLFWELQFATYELISEN